MKTVLIVVFLIVALVVALMYARLIPGSLSFFESYTPTTRPRSSAITPKRTTAPTVPPPPLANGTYTIQNLRNGIHPSYGNGSAFLSPSPIDETDKAVYMTNQNVDASCQWKIKLEDRTKNAYSIQNVLNSSNAALSGGQSYLSINVDANGRKTDKKSYFWNRPSNPACRWIIKKETTAANVYSLQNVFYGYDNEFKGKRESFLAVDNKVFSDNAVYVS